jgi:hypothetical protein
MMYWYLVAMIAVFLLSYWAYIARPRQCADLMGVSVLLSVVFVVNNVLVELYGFPDVMLAAPVLDLALCVMIYRAWKANPEPWKVFMVCALVAQLMLHAVAISMWRMGDLTHGGLHTYVVAVNGFFIVQLLTLGIVGASHGLDHLRQWMLDRRRDAAVPYAGR